MLRHLRRGSAIGSILTTDSTDRHGSLGPGHGLSTPHFQPREATDHTDRTDPIPQRSKFNSLKPRITRITRIQIPNCQLPAAKGPNSNSKPRIARITRIQLLTASCQLPTVQIPKATDHTDPIPNCQLPAANGPNSK